MADECEKCDDVHGSLSTKYDSVVSSVLQKFMDRAKFGQQKYGTNLDRTDLKFLDWANHMQEELMDAILYLEKMKNVKSEETLVK